MKNHKGNATVSEEVAAKENVEFSTASLPSRKEIHGKKKQKTKLKIKFPFVKMLALFFVILLGTVWAIASLKDGDSVVSSKDQEPEYTEPIGEISGFEDDEEDVVVNENETTSDQIEVESLQLTEEGSDASEQPEQATTTETITETTVNDQQNTSNPQQTTASDSKNDEVIQHVVQSNENLFRIALKYYSSADGVEIIKQYNGLKSNDIRTGQVLKIPPRK